MKKIKYISVFSLVLFFTLTFFAFAANDGDQGKMNVGVTSKNIETEETETPTPTLYQESGEPVEPKDGGDHTAERGNSFQEQSQEEVKTQNLGEESNLQVESAVEYKAQNIEELEQIVEVGEIKLGGEKEGAANQYEIRYSVHTLLASEDLIGGIGSRVSEIAKEFDNSVQSTIESEEKIENRGTLVSMFFGGDQETAEEIEKEVEQNKKRIEELNQLINQCEECAEEVKNILQEQIQLMEQEQERLLELAENEFNKKGIFGYLFGWLNN